MPIMFEGKYRRARKLQQERSALQSERTGEQPPLKDGMEKGDLLAMLIAAFLTFLPVILVVLGILAAAGYFFLVR